ncbi:MAG: histidine kinase [Bacteroidetes bacterium]|nr:histidine kinase [Bacteroidota bacterium]
MAFSFDYNKWLFKYKLLHIPFWMLLWLSTFYVYYVKTDPLFPQVCNAGMVIVMSLFPFYFTAHILIPYLLYKKKYFVFILSLALTVVGSGILMMVAVRSVDYYFEQTKEIITSDPAKLKFNINLFTWTAIIAAFLGGAIKIMIDSFRLKKQLYEVEKEKISAELNFLRSQINPHFLFNVINTIYFQIDKRNYEARASVEKLSEMLRYQLYECTTDKIEIKKEIDYVRSYVSVQTLRMEKGSDIELKVDGKMGNFKIAPLLILPIIENAFKHVSHFKDPSSNKIHIHFNRPDDNCFSLETSNTYDKNIGANFLLNSGGLGIQNLKRRLELIYPDRYELLVNKGEGLYTTTLKIFQHD